MGDRTFEINQGTTPTNVLDQCLAIGSIKKYKAVLRIQLKQVTAVDSHFPSMLNTVIIGYPLNMLDSVDVRSVINLRSHSPLSGSAHDP